jgi:hypothetical protein
MTQRRTFTAEFKTHVVLDLVSGAHSAAELCRQHQLTPQVLARWKSEFLERAPLVFEQDQKRSAEQERIRVGTPGGSAHDGIGQRKKSLGSVEFTLEQKRAVIAMLAQEYPVSVVCEVLECARSSYYHRPLSPHDASLLHAIEEVAAAWPKYGYRRVTHQLRREGWTVNHKRVARMMRDLGLHAQRKPKPRTTTTDSRHAFPRYPNLVEQLEIVRPEQVWVSDITYIGLRAEFV